MDNSIFLTYKTTKEYRFWFFGTYYAKPLIKNPETLIVEGY